MRINADFSRRAVVRPEDREWVASPAAGVERMMLDRVGEEVARATTLVRFAPGSYFDAHTHGRGEEYLVLDGVFSDETGDFPAGYYVRNPIGSSHTPHTEPGCTIFVKLCQFEESDTAQFAVDTPRGHFEESDVAGVSVLPLHEAGAERVVLERWAPGTARGAHSHPGGEEVLVLEGRLSDEEGDYPQGTWLRNPAGSRHAPRSDEGCLLYVKTGHLKPAT